MKLFILAFLASAIWFTADQQGQRAFEEERFIDAAEVFEDTMWKGVSLYRAGEFKDAQKIFARLDTAEAHFNRGNCLIFLGKYEEAVASFDRALGRRANWQEAAENREIAKTRAEALKNEGGDAGDQLIGADKIVFDKKKSGGQDTEVSGEQASSDSTMQALWLRRVQTKPADFLKAKFAYQERFGDEKGEGE
ncbi:MAG: tetratricopeptide repeat protein [Akkermansiaceae bacterium]